MTVKFCLFPKFTLIELFHVNYGEAFLREVYDKYKQAEINAQQFQHAGRPEAADFEEERVSFLNCLTELRNVYDTFDIIRDFIYNIKTAEPVIQGVPYNLRPRKQVNYKV